MSHDKVSKEDKLKIAADLTTSYIKSSTKKEGETVYGTSLSPEQMLELFKNAYRTVEEVVPTPEERKIGLG